MKIPINLASQPFRRDRAMMIASIAVTILLAGTLAARISLAMTDRRELADVRADVARLNQAVQAANADLQKQSVIVRKPENAEVIDYSVLINSLLFRKGISWTRMFTDLEKVLPYNVKIIQIHPVLNSANQVVLDMQVGSESQLAVIEFLKNLEESPVFGSVLDHNTLPPSQSEPLYRYRVSVTYAQKL